MYFNGLSFLMKIRVFFTLVIFYFTDLIDDIKGISNYQKEKD